MSKDFILKAKSDSSSLEDSVNIYETFNTHLANLRGISKKNEIDYDKMVETYLKPFLKENYH